MKDIKNLLPNKQAQAVPARRRTSYRRVFWGGLVAVLIIGTLSTLALIRINEWFRTHELVFNQVINVQFKQPIEIRTRQIPVREIVTVINEVPDSINLKPGPEQMIYDAFGVENYKVAVAVAKAESGLREDAININTNGTIDVGLFQINSIHFKKEGCSLKEVVTYEGNIACAKQLWKQQGWTPWVAFNTGAFAKKYE